MKPYNKRAGPHLASFAYPMSPTTTDEIWIHDTGDPGIRFELNRGLGEKVLDLLGFVQGPRGCWIRRMTDKEG